MIWLARTMDPPFLLLGALLMAVATTALHSVSVAIPVIGPGTPFGELPLRAVGPLMVIVMVGTLQHAASPGPSAAAARPLTTRLLLVGVFAVAVFVGCCLALSALVPSNSLDIARNAVGYTALLMAGQAVVGWRFATLVPVLYLFTSTVFGRGPGGSPQPWAWPVSAASPAELVIACAVAIAAFFWSAHVAHHRAWSAPFSHRRHGSTT